MIAYLSHASSDQLRVWFYGGFWGRRIELRRYRLDQIQDGG